jgi:hypothetical protein
VRSRSSPLLFCLLHAVLLAFPIFAQTGEPQIHHEQEPSEQEVRLQKEQAKKLNQERHESLKRDTDKLLKLTTELKEHVDKSNENMLSLDVIKKAEEIEKLARSVREKMKGY